MKGKRWLSILGLFVALLLVPLGLTSAQSPLGLAFTYQGYLTADNLAVDGACDLRFALWDDADGGGQVGPLVERLAVPVGLGRFTTQLDFGQVYTGVALWLEVSVSCPAGSGAYTTMAPRQALTAAPYAISTLSLRGRPLADAAPAPGQVLEWDGTAWTAAADDDTTYAAGAGLVLSGTAFLADETYLQRRVDPCGDGYAIQQVNQDGTVVCQAVDNTTYTAGTGLYLAGTAFGITTTYRLPQACLGGEIPEWNAGSAQWQCAADDDTTYAAGAGLVLSGTVFLADETYLQRRVDACGDGYAIRQVNQDGTVVCQAVDNTTYTAGAGLVLSGTVFLADETYLQRRVDPCGDGYAIRQVNQDGTVVCQAVDNTTYTAGTGLYLAGTAFGITTTYRLPQSCSSTQIARWDGTAWACADDVGVADHGLLLGLDDDDHPQYFALAQGETVTGVPAFNGGDTGSAVPPFYVDSAYPVPLLNSTFVNSYQPSHFGGAGTRYLAINDGTLNTSLNADLLDGLHAAGFAPGTHDHWGQTWAGSGTGLTLSGGAVGLAGSGSTYGLSGVSGTAGGYGVYGSSTAGGYGVYGTSSATAVWGAGGTYGVYGSSPIDGGYGLYGSGPSGYGVYGTSASGGNAAVYGTSSAYWSVMGSAATTTAAGVIGMASGAGYYGTRGTSPNGVGGYFYNNNTSYYALRAYNAAGATAPGLRVDGTSYFTGAKTGYVADLCQSSEDGTLEPGDVVVVTGASAGVLSSIPVMQVRRADTAYATGVVGIVDARQAVEKVSQAPLGDPTSTHAPAAEVHVSAGAIRRGDYLLVVTLGAYRQVKVDASYGAIRPGDLLVASPHAGYAMKAAAVTVEGVPVYPAGTIIGKALGTLEAGTGVVAVFVVAH